MKKLLLIFSLLFAAKSFAQYPLIQGLGNDSTLIRVGQNYKGGIKGGLINMSVADTTAANLLRIKAYPGAQIYTDDGSVWIRNITATGWSLLGGGVSPSGSFWAIGGNLFPVTVPSRNIGTLSPYGGAIGLMTNSVVRAIVPDAGFTLANDTTAAKVFTWNPTSKEWGYANWNNGGGATPTFQQVLTAGSTLATNDSVIMGGYVFKFKGGELVISSTGVDNGDYTLQNTGGTYFNVTGKYLKFEGVVAGEVDTLYGQDASGNVSKIAVTDLPGGGAGAVNVRRSIEKGTSDSLQLVNDSASFVSGAVKVYGYDTTRGWKPAAKIVLTSPQDKDGLRYKSSNGTWVNYSLKQGRLQFTADVTTNAPDAGDSLLTNLSLYGKHLRVYRDGLMQTEGDTVEGFELTDSILTVHPPYTAGEKIIIETSDTTVWHDIALYSNGGGGGGWVDITPLSAQTGLTESPTNVWAAAGSAFNDYGLSSLSLPSSTDGAFIFQIVATTGEADMIIGFNASNSNQNYTNYEAGVYMAYNGGSNPIIYKVDSGTPTTTGIGIAPGTYVGIFRVGSTFTIRTNTVKDTDFSTWTTRATLAYSSSATMYMNINPNNLHSYKLYYPQCLNCL